MSIDCYLWLDNGIKGDSQDDQHRDWIYVTSWNWEITQSGTTHEGPGGGGGKVKVEDIRLTKWVDPSTHDLIKRCCSGEHIKSGKLHVRKAGGTAPVEYMRIDLETIMITSYSTGGERDGLDRVKEELKLNFRRFQVTYTEQMEDGTAGPESQAGWEIAANTTWSA